LRGLRVVRAIFVQMAAEQQMLPLGLPVPPMTRMVEVATPRIHQPESMWPQARLYI